MARQSTDIQPSSETTIAAYGSRQLTSPGAERVLIAIDISGSMSEFDGELSAKRIEIARHAYQALLDISNYDITNYAVCCWNTICHNYIGSFTKDYLALANVDFGSPEGGTRIIEPLDEALNLGANRVILLTDGRTDGKSQVAGMVAQCVRAGIKIDTVGIGSHDEELLRWMSSETGGVYQAPRSGEEFVAAFQQLETGARLLLEHK